MQCSPENTFFQHYQKRPFFLEHLPLIETTRSWTFDRKCKQDPWKPRDVHAIVRVWPWFYSIIDEASEEFETFCWSEVLLYNPFHDISIEIGLTAEVIFQSWRNF